MSNELNKARAPHILNTSSNLLGFSFLILTSTRAMGISPALLTTHIAAVCVIIFAISTLLSYIAMHVRLLETSQNVEQVASYVFLFGQLALTVSAVLLCIHLI